jgi:CheY-like chemotaxis protein
MVIDDDHDIRESFASLLTDAGVEVTVARNGREALDVLRAAAAPPCLIFLDLMMPVMDGFEFRQEQSRDPGLADIPVIVITAGRTLQPPSNVRHVLRKPFRFEDVIKMVETYC